jgi:Ni/Co efflux regulator RcnB
MKQLLAAVFFLILGTPGTSQAAEFGVGVEFSDDEIRIINAWYRDHGDATHQGGGKHKHKALPPGIAKNLERGKPLPPGIAKQHLPSGLVSALPVPPRGFERVIVDGRVLLVEIATQVIHDILMDAVLR